MVKPTVLISIDTRAETETIDFGRAFIQSLCDQDERLVPELLSTSENYKDPFIGVDDFLTNWWATPVKTTVDGQSRPDSFDGPFWKRKSALASRGMVIHGITDLKYYKHDSSLWFECRWAKNVDFSNLFRAWVELSQSKIGMLHVFTAAENYWKEYSADSSFRVGSFGGPAKPGIPNIGWSMAFGKDYAHEVDVERIKAANFLVDQIGDVLIVRVTENFSDVIDDFEYFSTRRSELKSLFRSDLFRIKEEPSERPH